MKTLKVLSIIGLVLNFLGFILMIVFCDEYDYDAAVGWGIICVLYAVAVNIVTLVKCKTSKEINHDDLRKTIKEVLNEK